MRLLYHDTLEWDRQSTSSLPAEDFTSGRPRPRSSSADAVARFHRYYHLLRRNLGSEFTWNTYAKLLRDTLREYRTPNLSTDGVKKGNDVATQTPEVHSPPTGPYQCTPKRSRWSLEQEEQENQHESMRRRCRDMRAAGPSSCGMGSPLSRIFQRKLSGENKGLARDISSRIDRISTLARKKSSKQMKQLVRSVNKNGYAPLSSGYSSGEKPDAMSSESETPFRTPLSETSRGKGPKTRKKIKMEVVEYVY